MSPSWFARMVRRLARGGALEAAEIAWRRTGGRFSDVVIAPALGPAGANRSTRALEREMVAMPHSFGRPLRSPSTVDAHVPENARADLLACANKAVRGEVEVLGVHCRLDGQGAWRQDPGGPHEWPLEWGPAMASRAVHVGADVKVPWELSRGTFLVALGLAARRTGDPRFVRAAERWWTSWLAENPPFIGVNWTVPMEAALRAVNWLTALGCLEETMDGALRARVLASLVLHGRFVRRHLEWVSPVLGNHFFANLAGLAVLGAALRDRAEARGWLRFAHAQLEREVRHQFREDGGNFESSLPYHRFVLEMALAATRALHVAGRAWSPEALHRLRAAAAFLAATARPDGTVPPVGDDDDGRVVPCWGPAARTVGPTLAAARLLDDPNDPVGAEALLGLGASSDAPAVRGHYLAEQSGIAVLRGAPLGVLFAATPNGQDDNGGHAHNDKLSFELWWGKEVVVGDPGSGCYTRDPALRNRLRGTAAHATLMVDGVEENPIAGELFRLPDVTRARWTGWNLDVAEPWAEATHEGYLRLVTPVRHTRKVALAGAGTTVVVTDRLETAGEHDYLWTFPAPSARVAITQAGFAFEGLGRAVRLRVEGLPNVAAAVEPMEWSPRYGVLRTGQALQLKARAAAAEVRFIFETGPEG